MRRSRTKPVKQRRPLVLPTGWSSPPFSLKTVVWVCFRLPPGLARVASVLVELQLLQRDFERPE